MEARGWMDDLARRADPAWSRLSDLGVRALEIWTAGGWAMAAIAATALVMFAAGMHVFLGLRRKGFNNVPEAKWRRWIDHPGERRGRLGDLLDAATQARSLEESALVFAGLRAAESGPYERELRLMKICVATAPLLGLFGTVTGMLATFGALASGSDVDETLALISKGISEALITTETGLVVALPGLFFLYQLRRRHEGFETFLAHLETVCTQALYRELKETGQEKAAGGI